MSFFDDKRKVIEYIEMVSDYDGRDLIEVLKKYLEPGAGVLELGIGPGKDLDILKETYNATGSDNSRMFLDIYKDKHTSADVIELDAVTLRTNRKFDGIYSNKVLHHLTRKELKESFKNQNRILNEGGLALHTFWYGDKEEEYQGLLFVYYTEFTLREYYHNYFEVVEIQTSTDMDDDDSFYIILRKKPSWALY